jgi:hypothetical protein
MIEVVHHDIEKYTDDLHAMAKEGSLKARSDDYGWFVSEAYILPYFIDKRLIFKKMVFMTGCLPRKEGLRPEDEKRFLNEVIDYVKENMKEVDFIGKAQSVAVFSACPDGAECVPWGTYIIDIDKSEEEILASFEGKTRQGVRKGIKKGVTIETTDDIDLVFQVIKDTFVRQNSPYMAQYEYFKNLYENMKDNIKLYVAKADGEVQAVYIIAYDKDSAYSWYSGSAARMVNGANNLLHYQIMVDMSKMGIKKFNLVGARLNVKPGTKYANINKFKLGFKPEIIEGYAFRYIFKPWKFALYNLAIKAYFKKKGMTYVDPIDQIKNNEYD